MAGTAAANPIRIVCANTLGAALRHAEHGANAQRTFRFRHTGNLQTRFDEARQVLGMTIDCQKQFKALADGLALAIERVLQIFRGRGSAGDTTATAPEQVDGGQRDRRAPGLRPAIHNPHHQVCG
jgi:hypothetical protein